MTSWYSNVIAIGSHFGFLPGLGLYTAWLDWVAKCCERWRIRTGPILAIGFSPSLLEWRVLSGAGSIYLYENQSNPFCSTNAVGRMRSAFAEWTFVASGRRGKKSTMNGRAHAFRASFRENLEFYLLSLALPLFLVLSLSLSLFLSLSLSLSVATTHFRPRNEHINLERERERERERESSSEEGVN